jgi:hypothetical protein
MPSANDAFVRVAPDSTGKMVDTSEIVVGAATVERQRINVSDPTDANAHAAVRQFDPDQDGYAVAVRSFDLAEIVCLLQQLLAEAQELKERLLTKIGA